jgi:hypothetical protein
MYGYGSANVPYQEKYDTVHQHDDEHIEEFGARWRNAFRTRFGHSFKIDTTANMTDLVRVLANEYVKTHLAALKLRKFSEVMHHGRRLEKEAVSLGLTSQYGPRAASAISYQSDYIKRREAARLYAAAHPHNTSSSSKSSTTAPSPTAKFRRRWTSFARAKPAATNAAPQSAEVVSQAKPAASAQSDDDDCDDEVSVSDFDDDDAQFISYVEAELTNVFEVSAKSNNDKILQEQLRNDVAHLSIRLNQLETAYAKKRQTQAAVGPMYNTTNQVTGKCWNCGQAGHSWRRCPTKPTDNKAALKFNSAFSCLQ